jgi:MFS family permease
LLAGILLEGRGLLPPRQRTAIVLAMLWGAALASFSLARSYSLAVGFLFAAGFLELSFNAMAQSLVQLNAPVDKRGRVIGLFNMASLGLRAFSGVSVGLLGSLIGVHWSLALAALATLAVASALLALP